MYMYVWTSTRNNSGSGRVYSMSVCQHRDTREVSFGIVLCIVFVESEHFLSSSSSFDNTCEEY